MPLPEDSLSPSTEITRLLAEVGAGDLAARGRLYDLIYPDLRRIARAHLRGGGPATLSTTVMVNEAYLRLAGAGDWESRVHFLSVASRAMRQILVDHARRRLAAKRGGGQPHVTLDEERAGSEPRALEVLALDQALDRLQSLDARLAQVVELRFFGGLSVGETAGVLGITDRTVKRDWRKARSLLHTWLEDEGAP